MSPRLRSPFRLALPAVLFTWAALAPSLAAQDSAPLAAGALGATEPGEVRLRLSLQQLDDIGAPEVAGRSGQTADLGEIALRLDSFGAEIDGQIRSALGQVGFRSATGPDGRVLIEHDLDLASAAPWRWRSTSRRAPPTRSTRPGCGSPRPIASPCARWPRCWSSRSPPEP
jgi:hypothetical protein